MNRHVGEQTGTTELPVFWDSDKLRSSVPMNAL